MQHDDPGAWIALQRTPGVSAATLRTLILNDCDPRRLRQWPESALLALGITPEGCRALATAPTTRAGDRARRDVDSLRQLGAQLLTLRHPDYPPLLLQTADPPPLLYVLGEVAALQRPQVAIVGSRRCSRQGEENALAMARGLAQAGLAVTSGGALGIDGAAHRGALSVAQGVSVAVMGTGVDVVYPRRHRALLQQLQQRGALVSEFPLGTQPHRALFPQRNRLISGLSLGVLVVEAALQSGSLITARFALEQNRDVYAIPGPIHYSGSAGCHQLIQQGAQLVTAVTDILAALQFCVPAAQRQALNLLPQQCAGENREVSPRIPQEAGPQERRLLALVEGGAQTFEQLLAQSGLAVGELQGLLAALEVRGAIELAGGRYQRLVRVDAE